MKRKILKERFIIYFCIIAAINYFVGCGGGGSSGDGDSNNNDTLPDASAIIGPEGGVIEVTNQESPIYGTKLIIPENALNESEEVTIETSSQNINLPDNVFFNSEAVSLKCSKSSTFNNAVVVELPIDNIQAEDEYLDVMYYNENTQKWENVTSWYAYENEKMVFMTDHFSDFISVKKKILSFPKEIKTQFNMNTDTLEFENDDFYYCPQYSNGVCAGIAYFTEWFFENHGHGLRCYYNEDTAEQVACMAREKHLWSLENILPGFGWLPQVLDNHSTKAALQYALLRGNPQTLAMNKVNFSGHAVVVYAWTATDDEGNGYFSAYDVNDNLTPRKIYAVKMLVPELNFKPVIMYVENHPEWKFFGVWDKWGIDLADVYDSNEPDYWCSIQDSDADGILDDGNYNGDFNDYPCTNGNLYYCDDNCLNTPNPGQEDSDGDGIGDACDCIKFDANCDGCIDDDEIKAAIELWKNGEATIQELLDAIAVWKSCSGGELPDLRIDEVSALYNYLPGPNQIIYLFVDIGVKVTNIGNVDIPEPTSSFEKTFSISGSVLFDNGEIIPAKTDYYLGIKSGEQKQIWFSPEGGAYPEDHSLPVKVLQINVDCENQIFEENENNNEGGYDIPFLENK